MKKSIKYLLNIAAVACVALLTTACAPDGPEGDDTTLVEFPEQVVANVTAGEEFTLSFDGAKGWELSVPAESAAVFRIVDGENTTLNLYGSTTGPQEVKIRVANLSDFTKSHTCNVTLTMGGRSEVIAVLTLPAAERKINIYEALFSEADNYFALDSTSFAYGAEPVNETSFRWVSSNQYMQRIKVDANFNWSIVGEIPSWLVFSEAAGVSGVSEIVLTTVPEELPLNPITATFSLSDYTNADAPVEVSTFTVSFDGCADTHVIDMHYRLRFNTIGDYYDPVHAMAYVSTPAVGTVIAPEGVKFYTVVERDGKLYHDRYAAWISFSVTAYPEGADQKGLHSRAITVSVTANAELTERKAYLMALPKKVAATITDPATQLYADESRAEIAYNLRDYIYAEIEQAPYVPPGAIDATDIATMRSYLANFEEVENAEFLTGAWSGVENAYKLTYKETTSGDFLTFNIPFERYEIYGYNGPEAKFEDLDKCWVSMEQKADTTGIYHVVMNPTKDKPNTLAGPNGENVAYMVFYNAEGAIYAVLQCVLDPNYEVPPVFEVDTSAVAFIGEETFDATIDFLKPGDPDYDTSAAASYPGVIQVRLTHRNAMASYVGMKLPEYSTWRSTQSWLKVSQNAGLPCINMMDLVGNSGRGTITFYDENSRAVLIMVCVFGFGA